MEVMTVKEAMQQVVDYYGVEYQTWVAIEELSEMQKELCKYLRGIGSKENLTEELADVMIVTAEIALIYDMDDSKVQEVITSKLGRTVQRMREEAKNGRF